MKVFARDGSLPDDSLVSNSAIKPKESEIDVEPRRFEPTVKALAITTQDFTGTPTPAN